MGMFSTLLHDGKEFQFKTGFDDGGTFKVGDRIPWTPDPYWPGVHIDGVHDATGNTGSVLVVIKDCVVVAVEKYRCGGAADVILLTTEYGITGPDTGLWTPQQWKDKGARAVRAAADFETYVKETGGDALSFYFHKKLKAPSVIDQILPARRIT